MIDEQNKQISYEEQDATVAGVVEIVKALFERQPVRVIELAIMGVLIRLMLRDVEVQHDDSAPIRLDEAAGAAVRSWVLHTKQRPLVSLNPETGRPYIHTVDVLQMFERAGMGAGDPDYDLFMKHAEEEAQERAAPAHAEAAL